MLKEDLLSYLDEETRRFVWEQERETITAAAMAKQFRVKRNTVSHYLNQMVNEERVIKINTRPVYFLSRSVFEERFFPLPRCVFESFDQLQKSAPQATAESDLFDQLIGAQRSLRKAIEQIKTSVFYPDSGLPLMLNGPTGVGKSYLAHLIYRYSVAQGVLPADAPMISFNCAQYANNPELLSSQLFGYVKGAFTGAETTKQGMLDFADGGILFLDEVHRLNPEGQEKLFTFLDRGVFRRMGESDGGHKARVRFIFATTENLEQSFLPTFLRRIPIRVWVPALDERGEQEKKQFIYMFLIDEARKLQLPLRLSSRTVDALVKHTYEGNLGDLKNTITYIAASAYVKQKDRPEVSLTLRDLPESVLEDTMRYTENKYKPNDDIVISPHATLDQLYESSASRLKLIKETYERILAFCEKAIAKTYDYATFEQNVFQEILVLFDKLIFQSSSESTGVMMELTTVSVQEAIRYLESAHNVMFNGNSVYAVAHFLYHKGDVAFQWHAKQQATIAKVAKLVDAHCKVEQRLAQQLVHLLENKLDVKLYRMDKIFLTLYLKSMHIERASQQMKAVIIAHGYATASSIANVANRLLRRNVFEAFDMPIDVSVEEIVKQLSLFIDGHDVSKGLVILVDMGSLEGIHSQLKDQVNGPVAIINNVSTQMAFFLGAMLDKEMYLEEMIEKLNTYNKTEYSIIYPVKEKQKVIVTSCLTGMGTAVQIQKLLEASIPEDLGIDIIAHDYDRLKMHGASEAIFQMYHVLAVVGTADPGLEQVNYISLEDLISGEGEEALRKTLQPYFSEARIQEINNNIIRHCSLERVIESVTILDTEKILAHVEAFLQRLELLLNKRLTNGKKIALSVHVSCLVERLIRQAPIENYANLAQLEQCQKEMIKKIKEAFSVIETMYNVKINDAEIGYIYDYLAQESSGDNDF